MMMRNTGASLIEVLIGMLIVTIASVGTLVYFGLGVGKVGQQGNHRAALERARERLEQLTEVAPATIKPSDFAEHTVSCAGGTCTVPAPALEKVPVGSLPPQKILSTVRCTHDLAAGTPNGTCDVLELSAKVWFTNDDTWPEEEVHRVYIRTLRTP